MVPSSHWWLQGKNSTFCRVQAAGREQALRRPTDSDYPLGARENRDTGRLGAVSLSWFPPWLQLSCHADVCICSKMCYTNAGHRWTEYPESTARTLLIRHHTGLSEQAKRQHLTHAAGKLHLASGAETMTSTNLPLRK